MRRPTILFVDDEPGILDCLGRLFRKDGCELLFAGSGEEGLEILQGKPVDLILADNRMPGMSGIEFLQCARQVQPDAVRVILSGYTDNDALTSAISHGEIFKYIPKPWNNEELKTIVRSCLEQT